MSLIKGIHHLKYLMKEKKLNYFRRNIK